MMQSHRQREFCANLMYDVIWCNLTPDERVTRSERPGYPSWRVTSTYHVNDDQIKMTDYTQPKQVTSPTWGPPPPSKTGPK